MGTGPILPVAPGDGPGLMWGLQHSNPLPHLLGPVFRAVPDTLVFSRERVGKGGQRWGQELPRRGQVLAGGRSSQLGPQRLGSQARWARTPSCPWATRCSGLAWALTPEPPVN